MTPVTDWPCPAHFSFKTDPSPDVPATLVMANGETVSGKLTNFDFAKEMLSLCASGQTQSSLIPFADFNSVNLSRRVVLSLDPPENSQPATRTNVQRRSLTVQFHQGNSLVGKIIDHVVHEAGLFLFLIRFGNDIFRCFVPWTAVAKYEIDGKTYLPPSSQANQMPDVMETGRQPLLALSKSVLTNRLEVEYALREQKALPHVRLGEAFIQESIISQEQLDTALSVQAADKKRQLGEILTSLSYVTPDILRRVLAQKLGIPLVDLKNFAIDAGLDKEVPVDLIRKYQMMPLFRTPTHLVVAMENPLAMEGRNALGFAMKLKIDAVMAPLEEVANAIKDTYGTSNTLSVHDLVDELGGVEGTSTFLRLPNEEISESDNALVRLVNKVLVDAFSTGASDIHVECMADPLPFTIRFRCDGILSDYAEIPANFKKAFVSRLKIMARLDISERRKAQDGKINFSPYGAAKIELRVLTIPTTDGLEDVVLRVLAVPKVLSIETLDLSPQALESIKRIAHRPHGLLFVCGPTGSGKTTTLHSVLSFINTRDKKIWTVEDPIEITQRGLRQVQVQSKIEWSFSAVLRSFMRADPDIIMVGETRDPETARTVIEASLTGHLVLSTMHTNSAAESVVRLLDLGLDPFNFGDALLGVLGQRLVRRLCTTCSQPYAAGEDEIQLLATEYCAHYPMDIEAVKKEWHKSYANKAGEITLRRAIGCEVCGKTGYKGRLGIQELLLNTPAMKRRILAKENVVDIVEQAMADGMTTLKQDGITKVLSGLTDWVQVRVISA